MTAAQAAIRQATRRTDRALFMHRWSTRKALARLRRCGHAFMAFAAIFGGPMVVGYFDMQDEIALARFERDRAAQVLAEDRALHGLPNPAIVIDAENARRYGLRLAEIAGGIDKERAELRGVK